MKLLEIYRAVLRYCGMEADDQGFINFVVEDKREPAMIDGLRMVLPTDHHLRNFDPKERIVFHPLTENPLRGESEVIQKLKQVVNVRLNVAIGIVAQSLLNLVASPEQHSGLTPEQRELLTIGIEADDKSVTNFISVMLAGLKTAPERLFTNIYLKRGGNYREKRYGRVGIVTFPFYTNLLEDKVEKIRVKDKETYRLLFNYIFPNLENSEEYNFGSDSRVAPYMEALLKTSANIASRLNDMILLYKDFIEDADKLMFDAEWMEYFQDMEALTSEIRKVPVQHGSEGSVFNKDEPQPIATASQLQQVARPAEVYNPGYQQQPQVAMAPARPEIKQTKRGLDFKSVVQNNPAMAMMPNPMAPMMANQWQQHQMQQQQRPPSWAAPQAPQMPSLPPGAFQGPNGAPCINTQQGMMMLQLVQTQQGPMWQPVPMPPMQPMPAMMPMGNQPPWAGPQMLPQSGYGYPR